MHTKIRACARENQPFFERALQGKHGGNKETCDLWERFRDHRERVTAEILALAPGGSAARGGRLCLLGAGNANDLDLGAVAARFDKAHLVDIGPAALERATERQSPAVKAKLRSAPGGSIRPLLSAGSHSATRWWLQGLRR
jgi:hypothetical protein